MTKAPSCKGHSWVTMLFGWSYFVLMWNLVSRSELIASITLQHMEWTEDCLSIEEQGHMGAPNTCTESIYAVAVSNPGTCRPSFFLSRAHDDRQTATFIGFDNKNVFGRTLHRAIAP
ncbi:hypothetical protein GQ600_3254 [Phytophthora cactorum]|nr:hypothetical protein GQ600_3254 [Phytophthora cactorum]